MKIIVFQQNKRIKITFRQSDIVDSYEVAKAEGFLDVLDRFIKKRKIELVSLRRARLEFRNVGLLTERTIRAIMLGLGFFIS